jgi:5-formyltetrahydrofolate cyclo-ligase
MTTKHQIRQIMSAKLRNLSANDYHHFSDLIENKTIKFIKERNPSNILVYLSSSKLFEPSTSRIILELSDEHQLFAPVIIDGQIWPAPYNPNNLVVNQYGIKEPAITNSLLQESHIDLAIIPVLSFDDKCNRLGRGLGYYDKYLSQNGHIIKIGLAFELQKTAEIPTEEHDVQLDIIITENNTYEKS